MINDELTVFDIKYNEGLERLNNLLSDQSFTSSIKNYVERYKLDKSLEDRNSKKNYTANSKNTFKDNRRNQIVDLYEIRNHDRKVQQVRNKNYLKNEIEWFKIKEREDEQKNKYNYNKQKYEKDSSDNNQDVKRNNNIKMKKFASIANKVNIDKFLEKKKLNQNQNLNNEKNNTALEQKNSNNNNKIFQDGVFIPYSEYKQYEQVMMNKNQKNSMNVKKLNNNFNTNKSEKIYNNVNLNNNISQNKNIIKKNNIKKNNTNKNINNNINNNVSHSINVNNNKFQSASSNKNKNKIPVSQEKNKNNRNSSPKNIDNRYNIDIRKPLEKRIDYLREKPPSLEPRVKIYDSKKLFKDKKDILNNIDSLNYYSKKYENEAKRQEQLMRVRGNKSYGNDDNVKLSNLLIDSISTKLAILNQLTSDKNK